MKTRTRTHRNGSASRATKQGKNRWLHYSGALLKGNPPPPMPSKPGRLLTAKEFKVVALRECPLPDDIQICDTPQSAADYWRCNISNAPHFNPDMECLVVLILNTRRRVKGHILQSIGSKDTLLVDAGSVFRAAVIAAAWAIIIIHNHPSGDPSPSEADIKVTRNLIRGGEFLNIHVLDHLVMGQPMANNPKGYCSLREHGYFFT